MADFPEKIIITFVSEFVEAIAFLIILLVIGAFPAFPGKESLSAAIVAFWITSGIATPILILTDALDFLGKLFK